MPTQLLLLLIAITLLQGCSCHILDAGKPAEDLFMHKDAVKSKFKPALSLTELLRTTNSPQLTKNASRVFLPGWDSDGDIVESYAGFVQTNATTDNNLFFWYYPAQNGAKDAPLAIWLQGGPGGSSQFGNFAEIGPFFLTDDGGMYANQYTWNDNMGLLFIDNPVGAGFSYTSSDEGYCDNTKTCVANNLYAFLETFYAVFQELQQVELYITGESYAGHYVPAIAHKIYKENQNGADLQIHLAGIAIGDGWVDPVNQVPGYADLMFNVGMASTSEKKVIESYQTTIVNAITNGNYKKAFNVWDEMINGDIYPYPNYFFNITHSYDYDNFVDTHEPSSFNNYYAYLNKESVRQAIHVGNHTFQTGNECEMHLVEDFMVSFVDQMAVLMENMKVLIYNGQYDLIIGAPLTELYLDKLEWSGQQDWLASEKTIWSCPEDIADNNEISGYVRQTGQFTQVVVRGAGHIVPADQGARAKDMINNFVFDKPFETAVTL